MNIKLMLAVCLLCFFFLQTVMASEINLEDIYFVYGEQDLDGHHGEPDEYFFPISLYILEDGKLNKSKQITGDRESVRAVFRIDDIGKLLIRTVYDTADNLDLKRTYIVDYHSPLAETTVFEPNEQALKISNCQKTTKVWCNGSDLKLVSYKDKWYFYFDTTKVDSISSRQNQRYEKQSRGLYDIHDSFFENLITVQDYIFDNSYILFDKVSHSGAFSLGVSFGRFSKEGFLIETTGETSFFSTQKEYLTNWDIPISPRSDETYDYLYYGSVWLNSPDLKVAQLNNPTRFLKQYRYKNAEAIKAKFDRIYYKTPNSEWQYFSAIDKKSQNLLEFSKHFDSVAIFDMFVPISEKEFQNQKAMYYQQHDIKLIDNFVRRNFTTYSLNGNSKKYYQKSGIKLLDAISGHFFEYVGAGSNDVEVLYIKGGEMLVREDASIFLVNFFDPSGNKKLLINDERVKHIHGAFNTKQIIKDAAKLKPQGRLEIVEDYWSDEYMLREKRRRLVAIFCLTAMLLIFLYFRKQR